MADKFNFEGKIIKNRWKVTKRIGQCHIGQIYMCIDKIKQQVVCIKIVENSNSEILLHEAGIMSHLCPENKKTLGFPQLYFIGQDPLYNKYQFMISQILGPSLSDLFKACNKKFSLKTVLLIANGCLNQIERLHKYNYVHCNIQPKMFKMGLGDCSHIIYLTDFSICQLYRDNNTNSLIQYKVEEFQKGSLKFMSMNGHYNISQGRRDDLESLGYMLIYFLKGKLPWQKHTFTNIQEKEKYIKNKKLNTIFEEYCQDLPPEFILYLNYCKDLVYYEEPDYEFLKSLFIELSQKNNYDLDFEYDWVNISNINQQNVSELTLPLEFIGEDQESGHSYDDEFVENDAYFKQDAQQKEKNTRKKFSVFKKPMSSVDLEHQSIKEFDIDSNTQSYTESNCDLLRSESEFDREVTLIEDKSINGIENIKIDKNSKKLQLTYQQTSVNLLNISDVLIKG